MLIVTFRTLQFSSLGEVHNSFMTRERFHRYRRDKTLPLSSSFSLSLSLSLSSFRSLDLRRDSKFSSGFFFFYSPPVLPPFSEEKSMPECNTAEIEKFERARSSHVIEKPSRSAKAFSIVIFRVAQPSIHLDMKKKKKREFELEVSRKCKIPSFS